ncbi:hypothetical protein FOZ60_004934 [Perkinsus olseni]|uniref:Uncharacterized protein n=1 Tax=Perkinsus olseni TaxID=32597 RepID=A0A7J6NSB2_PEROL|nr:hypothetical protein FOZ60_004934 [Perkinsus olseni]
MMMLFFYLTVLITQAVAGQPTVPPFPFPQGRYIGGQLSPMYLRIETNFVTVRKVPRVHLRISCGCNRDSWDGWFDLGRGNVANLFTLKDYQTHRKYAELFIFYNAHCGRARGRRGDLAVFSKDPNSNKYATRLGKDTIFLHSA